MTEQEFHCAWEQIDAEDVRAPFHSRFSARSKLVDAATAGNAPKESIQFARLDAMMFVAFHLRGELTEADAYHSELRSEAGIAFASRRAVESKSAVVRAISGWFLWAAGGPAHKKLAGGAPAFVEWLEEAVNAALTATDGYEATEVLEHVLKVLPKTGQTKHYPRVFEAALKFVANAHVPALSRWSMDMAQAISSLPRELWA